MKPDFTIGCRGGDWYAFHDTAKGRDAIRANGVITGKTAAQVEGFVIGLGCTCRIETRKSRTSDFRSRKFENVRSLFAV